GFNHTSCHIGFGGLTPRTWIIFGLVPDVAINLEHTVIVFKHMGGDRTTERVRGVGVDVHLDHTVGHGICDVLLRGTRATVEYQIKWAVLTDLSANGVLDLLQKTRTQLNTTWFVHTVYVAEGECGNVPAVLAGAQGFHSG